MTREKHSLAFRSPQNLESATRQSAKPKHWLYRVGFDRRVFSLQINQAPGSLRPPRADLVQHVCLEGLRERLVDSGGWVKGLWVFYRFMDYGLLSWACLSVDVVHSNQTKVQLSISTGRLKGFKNIFKTTFFLK